MASYLPKAPWRKEEPQQDHGDQSLTTVLKTHEDRASLLLLVISCLDSMRKNVEATFDPSETGRSAPSPTIDSRPASSSALEDDLKQTVETASVEDKEDEKNKHESAVKEAEDEELQAKRKADAKEKARQEYDKRAKELNSSGMQELKESALQYFQEWHDRVIERVGEAINQPKETEGHKEKSHEGAVQNVLKNKVDEAGQDKSANTALKELYPPEETPIAKLDEATRVLILHTLLLLVLSLEHYAAQSRVLLLKVASSLNLPITILTEDECKVAQGLLEAAKQQMNADEETKKKSHDNVVARRWKVGLGAAAGATLIGVTGT